jgi:hypothetical protein
MGQTETRSLAPACSGTARELPPSPYLQRPDQFAGIEADGCGDVEELQ